MENKDKFLPLLINIESTSGDERIDPEDLERNTQSLREELSELDVIEKVDLVAKGKTPEGSKSGGEMIALGSMLATLATSAGNALIPSVANTIQSWLTRHKNRKIILEIGGDKLEVEGISDKDQQRLIDAWISGHSRQ